MSWKLVFLQHCIRYYWSFGFLYTFWSQLNLHTHTQYSTSVCIYFMIIILNIYRFRIVFSFWWISLILLFLKFWILNLKHTLFCVSCFALFVLVINNPFIFSIILLQHFWVLIFWCTLSAKIFCYIFKINVTTFIF